MLLRGLKRLRALFAQHGLIHFLVVFGAVAGVGGTMSSDLASRSGYSVCHFVELIRFVDLLLHSRPRDAWNPQLLAGAGFGQLICQYTFMGCGWPKPLS